MGGMAATKDEKVQENGGGQHLHRSVLLDEALDWWTKPFIEGHDAAKQVYVDCTFGRGGHSKHLLKRVPSAELVIFDKDPSAIAVAQDLRQQGLAQSQELHIVHDSFATLGPQIEGLGFHGEVQGILMDLGVSSPQLDEAERGFSFMRDGPLDMRMDTSKGITAAQWLQEVDEKTLADVIYTLGEEKLSRRIAKKIVQVRAERALTTTMELADLLCTVVPRRVVGKHPATRTFQAIRMHINEELKDLKAGLEAAFNALIPGGYLVVLSFHSLEDRIVKHFMQRYSKPAELPRGLPVKASKIAPPGQLIIKGQKPRDSEVSENPRARSAILRVVQKKRIYQGVEG